ncbi:MAG: peroxidase family protein, partial [Pirellulaceae bacterium]|nr:peroxidase family protein [Pirellulaceae bacterium]
GFCNHSVQCFPCISRLKSIADRENHPQFLRKSLTFNEFLPSLLGRRAISRYSGYDASVDPTIANEFSTAAFRFGHSTLNDDIGFFDNDGRDV